MLPIDVNFWIIMLLSLLLGFWLYRGPEGKYNWSGFGFSLLIRLLLLFWLLLVIVGWATFGFHPWRWEGEPEEGALRSIKQEESSSWP